MWEQLNDLEVRAAAVALGCDMNLVTTKDSAIKALADAGIEEMQAKAALVRMANSLSALTPSLMPGIPGITMSAPPGMVSDENPKRNVSAYCWFVQRNRDRIQASGEQGEKFMTRAVRLWQELHEDEKDQYERMAKEDKERYKRERRTYKAAVRKAEADEDGGGMTKRRKKHPDAPKRSVPAYMLYANQERENVKAEMPHKTHREILGELGRRWRSLSEDAKAPYEREAEIDRARYNEEIAKWREDHPEPKDTEADAERRRRRKKEEGAPKRAQTAFLYYANELNADGTTRRSAAREEYPEKSHKEVLVILGERWKHMPQEEKEPYLAHAQADRARYHAEMIAWRENHPKEQEVMGSVQPDQQAQMVANQLLFPGMGIGGGAAQNAAMQNMALALMGGGITSMPKRRGRKKKEPGAPKKCSTAFLFYANVHRSTTKEQHPDLKHSELLKVLGEQWRHLSDVEKEPYEEQAKEDRIRYEREMDAWRQRKAAEPDPQLHQAAQPYQLSLDPTQAAAQAAALTLTLNPAAAQGAGMNMNNMYGYLAVPQVSTSLADLTSTIAGSLGVGVGAGVNSLGFGFDQDGV
mmetsp:Transcript_34885/g.109581  ORF Transcript_34885/g.109581 Transcript_34885/m.109581 type:complete len:582 (-) Transcript_34885:266-2011(-)|eukprot:CAMPEP_0118888710 /NCGR_PEP_ID=MMETSP1163-20130328/25859_1 /TAXON_ID=124430 /ORGANISM="Phaeomonas parva, Strain CCMP2877" /LENGTH=581 /DNA_ID=CAMNT_0006827281 /DNA_START=639 /DNA_END=2384 /DNA_ORIENTATION=+